MRPLALLLTYFVVTFLVGSLLAYLVYQLSGFDYARVLSRAVVVAAFMCAWPLARMLSLSPADIGWRNFSVNRLTKSWLTGWLLISPVVVCFMLTGYRTLDSRVEIYNFGFVVFVLSAIVSGVLVALVEETICRGVFPELFRRTFSRTCRGGGVILATCLSSLIYASVHFLDVPENAGAAVTPLGGFAVALRSFVPLGSPAEYWDSFIALFLVGVALCIVRYTTGSLAWCLGLHAAFVTCIRVFKELTIRGDGFKSYAYLAGTHDHFVGVLVAGWLLVILAVVGVYLWRDKIRAFRWMPRQAAGLTSPKMDTRSP